MVSDEFFRLREPLTVEALPEDTMLACFSCEMADIGLAFPLTVLARSTTGEREGTLFFGGGGGGTSDFREDFFDAEVEAEETVECMDAVDGVLFAGIGASLLASTGEGCGCFPLTDIFEAVEVTRERGTFGEDVVVAVPVVLTLVVDTVDTVETRRERAAVVGVTSDFAVSKFVDPSLVVDMVEAGRERLEVGRKLELPTMVLRTVAVDRADLKEAAEERGWEPSDVEAEDMTFRLAELAKGLRLDGGRGDERSSDSTRVERVDGATEVLDGPGVSLESGRVLIVRRAVVAMLTRETVECVLRATERIEVAEDFNVSPPGRGELRRVGVRTECTLVISSSTLRPPVR